MQTRKWIFSALFLAFAALSCEDQLDIENPNQPTSQVFWQTANDAELGVNAIYSTLHRVGLSRWYFFATTVRSDVGYSVSPDNSLINNYDLFLIEDYNYGKTVDIWVDCYVGIFRANQVLANVPDIQMDQALRDRFLGEARFMRGLFYYILANLWGNVPLMLEPSRPASLPPTAPVEQVWAQIETDLTQATQLLPVRYAQSRDLGRATRGAAYALLAKTLMQQRKFQEALAPLDWLVNGEGAMVYGLMNEYRQNFLSTTENNRESVFEWQFANNPIENHDNDTDPQTDRLNYGTSIPRFFAPRPVGFADAHAHRWVVHEFLEEPTTSGARDPRLAATFLFDSTDVRGPDFSMIYGQPFTQRFGRNNREVYFRKFLNDATGNMETFSSPNNYRFIRYADVLLMYAESLNEVGRTQEAYAPIDRVRQRVGLPALSTAQPNLSQAEMREQIKHERLLELTGEGHRWNDLARWGDLGPKLASRDPAFANFVVGRDELLPIPQQDLDSNPNLNQNPGW